jgi:HAMP domain-containing protein
MSREPIIVETVTERNQELSETLDDLLDLELKIEELETRVEEMSQTERNSFYRSVTSIKKQAINANTPEELLDLRHKVTEAVRSPLQQAALQALKQLLNEFVFELTRAQREEAVQTVKSAPPEELESFATTYQILTEKAQGLGEIPKNTFASWVEADISRIQKLDDLESQISDLEEQQSKLEQIEHAFDTKGESIPRLDFTGSKRFYEKEARDIDPVSDITLNLDAIVANADRIKKLGLEVDTAIRKELESWYESGEPAELSDEMTSIQDDLQTLEKKFQRVQDLTAKLEDYTNDDESQNSTGSLRAQSNGSTDDTFLPQIDALLEREEKLKTYQFKSLSYMEQEIEELEKSAEDLVDSLFNQLSTLREFYQAVDDGGDITTSPLCEIDKSSLQKHHVKNSPVSALEEYNTLEGWLYEYLGSEQKEVIELWKSLNEGDPVEITSQNKEAVLMLADRLNLSVMLGDQYE